MGLSFTIIGMSDSPHPFFAPDVLERISASKVFSGGKHLFVIMQIIQEVNKSCQAHKFWNKKSK